MKLLLTTGAALTIALSVLAADTPKTADEIITFSKTKMAGVKNWQADVTQSMNAMGMPMQMKGKMTAAMPDQLRMQMTMDLMGQAMTTLIVIGADNIMWQDANMAGQQQVTKLSLADVASNTTAQAGMDMDPRKTLDPVQQWEVNKKTFDFTVQPSADLAGQAAYVLEGTFKPDAPVKAPGAEGSKTRLYVNQQTGFISKVEQLSKDGKPMMTMEFSNVKFDQELPADTFKFTPPAGVKVMDLKDMMRGGPPSQPESQPTPPPAPTTEKN